MKSMRRRNDHRYPFARKEKRFRSENPKTVLILGCGLMQRPAIETAKAWGWKVIGFDANAQAEAVSLCDCFEPVNIADTQAVVEAAVRLDRKWHLDGVFTAGTDFSFNVASAAQALGLPGHSPEAAFRASNKAAMRDCFARRGVSSPEFVTVASAQEAAVASLPSFPLVVKPVDNMGGRGTRRVDSAFELTDAVTQALAFSRSGEVIIEEFIDGPEFSLDAIVCDGKVTVCGFADRHIFFPPYFIEMGHTMSTAAPAAVCESVEKEFRKAVAALGLTTGAAKGDVKYSPSRGKAVIGEVAARLSGGYMSGWTYPYSSGVNVTAAALRLAVGEKAGAPFVERRRFSAERAFLSIPGEVSAVEGVAAVLRRRCVKHLFLRAAPGNRVRLPRNNVEKCGNVITAAPVRAKAIREAEKAARRILIRLKPCDAETEAFLFNDEENRAYYRQMSTDFHCRFFFKKTKEIGKRLLISYTQKPLFIEEKDKNAAFEDDRKQLKQMKLFVAEKEANLVLDGLFWHVYRRAGVQGAVWLSETLHCFFQTGMLDEVLEKWSRHLSSADPSSV